LRRLGVFLSKKGSMEAVQRKMNIYSKYLPLIARFATELADEKKAPNYRRLIGEGEAASGFPEGEEEIDPIEDTESVSETESEIEQKKIDEYRGN